MGKIYIKTISGREYRYERLSSKRVNGKVVTHDKYIGPVHPVSNKLSSLSPKRLTHYRSVYEANFPISPIVEELEEKDEISVSESTVRNFFKKLGALRFPRRPDTRRAARAVAEEQKKYAKTKAEKETQHRFEILIEEKRISPRQIVEFGKGEGLDKKKIDAEWKKRGK